MIEDQLYRQTILEVARNPKNRGEISNPDLEARLVNQLCGDEIKLQLRIKSLRALRPLRGLKNSENIIKKAVFSGTGCAISQASASLLASYIEGKSLAEARKVETGDILRLLGINPSPARLGCTLLSLNVLKDALIKAEVKVER